MFHCVVLNCDVASDNLQGQSSFHSIPRNPRLRKIWLSGIGRKDYKVQADDFVCSKHFAPELLIKTRTRTSLMKGAVPTLNITGNSKQNLTLSSKYKQIRQGDTTTDVKCTQNNRETSKNQVKNNSLHNHFNKSKTNHNATKYIAKESSVVIANNIETQQDYVADVISLAFNKIQKALEKNQIKIGNDSPRNQNNNGIDKNTVNNDLIDYEDLKTQENEVNKPKEIDSSVNQNHKMRDNLNIHKTGLVHIDETHTNLDTYKQRSNIDRKRHIKLINNLNNSNPTTEAQSHKRLKTALTTSKLHSNMLHQDDEEKPLLHEVIIYTKDQEQNIDFQNSNKELLAENCHDHKLFVIEPPTLTQQINTLNETISKLKSKLHKRFLHIRALKQQVCRRDKTISRLEDIIKSAGIIYDNSGIITGTNDVVSKNSVKKLDHNRKKIVKNQTNTKPDVDQGGTLHENQIIIANSNHNTLRSSNALEDLLKTPASSESRMIVQTVKTINNKLGILIESLTPSDMNLKNDTVIDKRKSDYKSTVVKNTHSGKTIGWNDVGANVNASKDIVKNKAIPVRNSYQTVTGHNPVKLLEINNISSKPSVVNKPVAARNSVKIVYKSPQVNKRDTDNTCYTHILPKINPCEIFPLQIQTLKPDIAQKCDKCIDDTETILPDITPNHLHKTPKLLVQGLRTVDKMSITVLNNKEAEAILPDCNDYPTSDESEIVIGAEVEKFPTIR